MGYERIIGYCRLFLIKKGCSLNKAVIFNEEVRSEFNFRHFIHCGFFEVSSYFKTIYIYSFQMVMPFSHFKRKKNFVGLILPNETAKPKFFGHIETIKVDEKFGRKNHIQNAHTARAHHNHVPQRNSRAINR